MIELIIKQTGNAAAPILLGSIAIIMLAILTGYVLNRFTHKLSETKQSDSKEKKFRLEIKQASEDYVQAGICLPDNMDGANAGAVMRAGVVLLARQDPLAVRILLLQIMEVLSADEDIKAAMERID